MDCKITKSVSKDCKLRAGGIKEIALVNFDNISVANAASGIVEATEITLTKLSEAVDSTFLRYQVATESASATSTIQIGGSKDSKSLLHTVTGTIVGFPEDLVGDEYVAAVLSTVVIAVREASGDVYLYGVDNGLTADNFDYSTGTAGTDLNGLTFTFSGTQSNSPLKFNGTWAELLAITSAA